MFKSFNRLIPFAKTQAGKQAGRGTALYLELALGVLILLNSVALYLYFVPPGGSRDDLAAESARLKRDIAVTRATNERLNGAAGKVQLASTQTTAFENTHFLARRDAYLQLVSEVQRLTKAANIGEKDGTFTEEPIEGSRDLTLVSFSVNLEGTYGELMQFLNEVDHSPSLLILDSLNAAPVQSSGRLNLSLKFLTILREDPALLAAPVAAGGRP
jgi:hypothetical protein